MDEFDKAKLALLEREVAVKESELAQKTEEAKLSRWRSPLVVAIFAAAVGAMTNAGVTYYDALQARSLAKSSAENERILEMIKVGDPDQVQRNLEFLVATDLVRDDDTVESIEAYYKGREAGTGPGSTLSSNLSSLPTPDRNVELKYIFPKLRVATEEILQILEEEGIPLKVHEAYRHPLRQLNFYSRGRSTPGPKVTNARPWQILQNYGFAVDFAIYVNDTWSWSTEGENATYWERLKELAKERGLVIHSLEPTEISMNVSVLDLRSGTYPEGGDENWAKNLRTIITAWPFEDKPIAP